MNQKNWFVLAMYLSLWCCAPNNKQIKDSWVFVTTIQQHFQSGNNSVEMCVVIYVCWLCGIICSDECDIDYNGILFEYTAHDDDDSFIFTINNVDFQLQYDKKKKKNNLDIDKNALVMYITINLDRRI